MEFNQFSGFIHGEMVQGQSEDYLEVTDKLTGSVRYHQPMISQSQLHSALERAQYDFNILKSMSAGARADGLMRLADTIKDYSAPLTDLIISEAGKPRSYAEAEVQRSISTVRGAARAALEMTGEVVNIDYGKGAGRQAYTQRFPRGPVLAITPFNFPLNLALHKVAPAIAAGCSVILKPANLTPQTALFLARIFQKCELTGLQVVCCTNDLTQWLACQKTIAMVSFTGSDRVGWQLQQKVGRKPVSLELGGNAAVYVDEHHDTELDDLTNQLIQGAYLYAGQICISTQRLYVHKSRYQSLAEALAEKVSALVPGDPDCSDRVVGPLINTSAYEKVSGIIQEAIDSGAQVLAASQHTEKGQNLHPAMLLTKTTPDMKLVQTELFGPACFIEPVNTLDEGIQAINNSRYGLQVGVFSQDIVTMKRCFSEVDVGAVIMNDLPGFRMDTMPYGGVKDSGTGREGPKYAMLEMTEQKLLIY